MTLAAEARAAVRERPFLLSALRAGVVNYTAAARALELDGDEEAVATALRRFGEDLTTLEYSDQRSRVSMETGLGTADGADDDALLDVGGTRLARGAGDETGIFATGDVDAPALAWVLDRLVAADVDVAAAGVAGDALVVVVSRRDGPNALRVVEEALAAVPDR